MTQNPSSGGTTLLNPLSAGTSLSTLLQDILGFVIKIGAVVVVLMLVYVGFLFATAGGNESQITKAREALLWTVVGALILLGAQAIASGIQATANALSTGS
ncbi:MAG: TrbC/VirB2 family protein [Minisyncoccia bacterium]